MIVEKTGNLLLDDAQALVNTVNTVGVMGKGLALQFKRAFPANFDAYARACSKGAVQPGRIFATSLGDDRSRRPELTRTRARLLAALGRYAATALAAGVAVDANTSLLEAHKLVYLLQAGGLELGYRYERGHLGPYSADLDREISAMEGHYLIGFGDGTGGARADLRLLPAADQAEKRVAGDDEFSSVWHRVAQAMFGYGYPDGLELLSTVHFLARQRDGIVDAVEVARQVSTWSARKKRLFPPEDVRSAWHHLQKAALLDPNA